MGEEEENQREEDGELEDLKLLSRSPQEEEPGEGIVQRDQHDLAE